MSGFAEKLAAIKAKQEGVNEKKDQAEAAAAEALRAEREGAHKELLSQQETLQQEFGNAEKKAREAGEVMSQADAFVAEQGANLDPEVVAELAALKSEAEEAASEMQSAKEALEAVSARLLTFLEGSTEDKEGTEPAEAGEEKAATGTQETVALEETQEATKPAAGEEDPEEVETKAEQGNERTKAEEIAELEEQLASAEADLSNQERGLDAANNGIKQIETMLASFDEATLSAPVRLRESEKVQGLFRIEDVNATQELQLKLAELKDRYNEITFQIRENFRTRKVDNALVEKRNSLVTQINEVPKGTYNSPAGINAIDKYSVAKPFIAPTNMTGSMPVFEGELPRNEAYAQLTEHLKRKAEEYSKNALLAKEKVADIRKKIEGA